MNRTENDAENGSSSSRRGFWLKAGAVVLVLAALWFIGREVGEYIPRFADWVDGLGFWGPLVFIAGYTVATVAFIPGSVLTLAAGAVFGLLEGVLWVFIGATLGSAAAFLVARYLARGAVERRFGENRKFSAVDRAVGREGFKIVFLLRLSPAFPFNALNYLLGLTSVGFGRYVLASLGMLPGTVLYVYYGRLAGDVAAAAGGGVERDAGYWTVMVLGLLATIAVTVLVTRKARRALNRSTEEDMEGG